MGVEGTACRLDAQGQVLPISSKPVFVFRLFFSAMLLSAAAAVARARDNYEIQVYCSEKKVAGGLEYYGALGPVTRFDPFREQQHQFIPSIDLNVSPKWEFTFGVGVGATSDTDHLIIKMIVGRRLRLGGQR